MELDIPYAPAGPQWPATALRGPADADHYRVKVGRFGDRFYIDGDNGPYPSISTIKKASGNDWSFVALKRVAHADAKQLADFADLEPDVRYDRVKSMNDSGLKVAAGRGTIIHWWFEDMLTTGTMRDVTPTMLRAARIPAPALDEANLYRAAVGSFFDTYQPRLIAAETVVIHTSLNGVGYGGTADVALEIEGSVAWCDWKSRGVDSDHGAYPEEGAQIAAAARAEYVIVAAGDGVDRVPPPAADCGLVVSVKHDGVRIYPVDLDVAFDHFTALHAWWVARRDERKAIGKPWQPKTAAITEGAPCDSESATTRSTTSTPASPSSTTRETTGPTTSRSSTSSGTTSSMSSPDTSTPKPTDATSTNSTTSNGDRPPTSSATTDPDRRTRLLDRYAALNDEAQRRFKAFGVDRNDLDAIERALDEVDAFQTVTPLAEPTPQVEVEQPPKRQPANWDAVCDLVDMVNASTVRPILIAWVTEGQDAGYPWHPKVSPYVDNYERTRAALQLAVQCSDTAGMQTDFEAVRLLLTYAIDPDAGWPALPIGAVIGQLTIDQAKRAYDLADAFGTVILPTYTEDGRLQLSGVERVAA